jgi:hypothetical protein
MVKSDEPVYKAIGATYLPQKIPGNKLFRTDTIFGGYASLCVIGKCLICKPKTLLAIFGKRCQKSIRRRGR